MRQAWGTHDTTAPLQPKTWQLDQLPTDSQGYLYSCSLCEEALVLSKQIINPRKIQLIFNNTCPGCGFELDKVLKVEASSVPQGKRLLTSPACKDADYLIEPEEQYESKLSRGNNLSRDMLPSVTTGIDTIDKMLVLQLGQLVSLEGDAAHSLSLLLSVRAINPIPPGLDSDIVYVDGGNNYDAYTVSHHAVNHGLDPAKTQERIHLSRAFTHHQLGSLIEEKLPNALDQYDARLAIVSDITALYCDPDVRDKKEALDLFNKNVRFLANLAEHKHILIIITNLQSRSKSMSNSLTRTAHVSAKLADHGAYIQLTVVRHPFIPEQETEVVTLDDQTLARYL